MCQMCAGPLQDLLTSSVLMLPGSEKSEEGHKAAQMPRRTLGSPVQVTQPLSLHCVTARIEFRRGKFLTTMIVEEVF